MYSFYDDHKISDKKFCLQLCICYISFISLIVPMCQVYSGSLNKSTPYASIYCIKSTTSAEVVQKALEKFGITDQAAEFQLAEVWHYIKLE